MKEDKKIKNTTLVFLIKRNKKNEVTKICLAMKKRGFGIGRWNGVGGKVEEKETIEIAAERESEEEIGIDIKSLSKIAELSFHFPHNPSWDQLCHVYFCEKWIGDPVESEEMKPKWFSSKKLPFKSMWPDDIFWIPEVLSGKLLKAEFSFGQDDVILKKSIKMVKTF